MPVIRSFLAFTAMCLGCAPDLTNPSSGQKPPAPTGEIAVRVNVSGDPALGPASYRVILNGLPEVNVAPNDVYRVFPREGSYLVSLAPFSSVFSPAWCLPLGDGSRQVAVLANKVETVEFAVDCPPLEGTGRLTLVVASSGSNLPADFKVIVARLNGAPYSLTVTVPANGSSTNEVPVGAFGASIVHNSRCTRSYGETVFGSGPRMLRAGSSLQFKFTMTCS